MKMRSALPMKVAKYGYILVSAVFCVTGIWIILHPIDRAASLGRFFGSMMCIFGIIKLIGYFSKDLFRLAFQYDLQFGLLLCILGIITLTVRKNYTNFVCISYGVSTIADSLFKCKIAFDAKRFGIHNWWLTLALAVITALTGVTVTLSPSASLPALHVLLGISLLCEGILSLSVAISMVKIIDHQKPDVIDAEYFER